MKQFSQSLDIKICKEKPSDHISVDALAFETFGPGMYSRAAFRLREGVAPESELSFVAKIDGEIVGSVRLTKIYIGEARSLILGPLMVSDKLRNIGLGRELMHRSILAAKTAGHETIILVGDYAYYRQFGFRQTAYGSLKLPGPADPARILINELKAGSSAGLKGSVTRFFARPALTTFANPSCCKP